MNWLAVMAGIAGACWGLAVKIRTDSQLKALNEELMRYKSNFEILSKLDEIKRSGRSLDEYFIKNRYRSVAIYGMGAVGKRIYDELKDSDVVELRYGIEKLNYNIKFPLEIRMFREDDLPRVDAVIITTAHEYEFVAFELDPYFDEQCGLVSVREIVNGLL